MPSRKGESFGGTIIDDSENSAEFGHINTERGEKTLRGNELQKRREELLKRKAELGAKLRAAGIDTDKIDAEDRAEFYAKKGQKPPEAQTPVRTKEPIKKQESVKNQEPVRSKELESMEEELANAPEVAPAVVANKLLKHKGFKVVIAGAIVGLAATLGAVGISTINKDRTSQYGVDFEAIPDQSTAEEDFSPEVESAQGIKDGYGEEGMWLSESKPNSVAFSDFESVVEMFDGDVKAAVKYLGENEVESLSDYVSAIPGAVLDNLSDSSELKKFKDLDLSDTNEGIESELSSKEYDKLLQGFKNLISLGNVSEEELNGECSNAYMAVKVGDRLIGAKEAIAQGIEVTHENMQLVSCTTVEKNTKVYKISWEDNKGNSLGYIYIKAECGQIVEKGKSKRISSLPEITEEKVEKTTKVVVPPASVTPPETKTQDKPTPDKPTPDTPTPDKPTPDTPTPDKPAPDNPTPDKPTPEKPTPNNEHTPKNEEEEKKHAGEHVEPRDIDNNVTPPTTKEQDQENFDAIEKQRQEDEEARKAAERVAEEQRKAEEAAKEEAKNREVASETNQEEVQKADDAKENAEAEAAREQEAAAEAERANREDQEQRQEAQEEANAEAEQNNQESISHEDDTASERANAFANGDF